MFIAVVGISAGPSFVQGLKEVGPMLFIIGALATSLPLLLGLILARYVFKFHPALSLGCTAGARTTTAALGAVQDAVESETPALGYTVTYAVGNTLQWNFYGLSGMVGYLVYHWNLSVRNSVWKNCGDRWRNADGGISGMGSL